MRQNIWLTGSTFVSLYFLVVTVAIMFPMTGCSPDRMAEEVFYLFMITLHFIRYILLGEI